MHLTYLIGSTDLTLFILISLAICSFCVLAFMLLFVCYYEIKDL